MMNKRLIWNFEVNLENPLEIPSKEHFIDHHHQWESRFFWSEEQIIILNGLNQQFLNLSQYQLKQKLDTYFLLPNQEYNLKLRHDQLFYKPLLMKQANAVAYGKKVKLTDQSLATQLPDFKSSDMTALIKHIHQHGVKIDVEKEALFYKFKTTPITKLELARLQTKRQTHFSVSIESPCLAFVESITHQLLGSKLSTDYVSFLRNMTT